MNAVADAPGQYALTRDQLDMRDMIRSLVIDRVAPRAAGIDDSGEFPQDIRVLLAEHDILRLPFEEEHGVGVLTDGRTILGTGYSSDVSPYPSERVGTKPSAGKVTGRTINGSCCGRCP